MQVRLPREAAAARAIAPAPLLLGYPYPPFSRAT
jgi:hypothetical protein